MKFSHQYYGLMPYSKAFELMEKKRSTAVQQKKAIVLSLQHPLVYTAGLMTQKEHILNSQLEIISARRGGSVTLHNPGQLVVYPLVPLEFTKGLEDFIRRLESALLKTFLYWGYSCFTNPPHSGIWNQNGKIAFIGLGLKQRCIYHGVSINLFNDLTAFQEIFSCGLTTPVTRLADSKGELNELFNLGSSDEKEKFLEDFAEIFSFYIKESLESLDRK